MHKLILILIFSSSVNAGFFDNPTPTPLKMLDFYNQKVPNMLPDFNREKRLDEQIADSIIDGDIEYLTTAKNKKIFAIYTKSEEPSDYGVIMLHTRGVSPNDEHIIKPLRIDMAEHGYNTLSVQMPVLEKTAKYYDYVPIFSYSHPRIKAAIDFYKSKKINKIIIVANSCGAHMAMSYIDKYGDNQIFAFIGISMGATDTGQKVVKQYPIATMQAPVLDIIGGRDFLSVKKHAKTRIPHLALGNVNNKQIIVPKADHNYSSEAEFSELTNVIYSWLNDIKK